MSTHYRNLNLKDASHRAYLIGRGLVHVLTAVDPKKRGAVITAHRSLLAAERELFALSRSGNRKGRPVIVRTDIQIVEVTA